MKMKKYVKAVCMVVVFSFLVLYAVPAANVQAAQEREIIKLYRTGTSPSGIISIAAELVVNNGVEIIYYDFLNIIKLPGVTEFEIIEEGRDKNNTEVYVFCRFYYYGNLYVETVRIEL